MTDYIPSKGYHWIILAVIAVSSLLLCTGIWFWHQAMLQPHSDVPITSELSLWPYQDGITITELTAEAVDPHLNLFNDQFLIRYCLKGTITNSKGWKPKVAEAQITSRLVSARSPDHKPSLADVLIVPIVDVTQDATYSEERIPFTLKIEQIMHTMDWGPNQYDIRCLDKAAVVTVHQYK